jgi:hypothetical protein
VEIPTPALYFDPKQLLAGALSGRPSIFLMKDIFWKGYEHEYIP